MARPRWIIDQRQLPGLAVGRDPVMALAQQWPFPPGANGAHYTTTAGSCAGIPGNPSASCLSLAERPLPPELPADPFYALLDIEKWDLTPDAEYEAECDAAAAFGKQARAAGAVPVMSLNFTTTWRIRCAAKAAGRGGIVHAGAQGAQMRPATLAARLTTVRDAARGQVPGIAISSGVSTNPKYKPTAEGMHAAWAAAQAILGPGSWCWLNVIPPGAPAAIAMANEFLAITHGQ